MKAIKTEEMRELDRATIADFGVPGETLMERAGRGLADVVDDLSRISGFKGSPVRLFAGRGNNGGDVYCCARLLLEMGHQVEVWLAGERGKITGDALRHLEAMRSAGIQLQEVATTADWEELLATAVGGEGMIVDGILGTGIRGPARGVAAGAIQYINALSQTGPVVSVDIPSGLDSDTGKAVGDTVHADVTVTFGFPKLGLVQPAALEYVGNVEVVDIGLPRELSDSLPSEVELITADDLRALLPRRPRTSHKGTYGHLLIVSGATGYAGAVILAASAAARSGVGLVTVLVPESIAATVAAAVPEAMVHPAAQTERGSLAAEALANWHREAGDHDAILMGPGMTTHVETASLVREVLASWSGPLVLDADALNVLDAKTIRESQAQIVVTPHPGEMARLMESTVEDIQADRMTAARAACEAFDCEVILKGAGTLVGDGGVTLSVNLTGNPGMARGGMGDVLAGLLAGLLAQGLQLHDASRLAVFLHGRAADRVAWATSQSGMSAGEVVDALANVFGELVPR
jgi:hydroxyethylthiazole kinase-like uncharacterized protein yjeF